jgi:putative nucleotidyltransferase with HDIG domain
VARLRDSAGTIAFASISAALAAVTALTTVGSLGDSAWDRPRVLFLAATVASVVAIVAATLTIAIADRRDVAEAGLLGAALMSAAIIPLVRGLVTPGVLYDETEAFHTTSFIAVPLAALVAAPLFAPSSRVGNWAICRWRDWVLLALLAVFSISSVIVFFPDAIRMPGPSSPITVCVVFATVAAVGLLAARHLRYWEIGRRPVNLAAALSLAAVACSAMLPLVETPFGIGFWWLHSVGLAGVLGASAALAVTRGLSSPAQEILAPVLARTPLAAFELGLSPTVHRFVADLERKDQQTREHTVRTAEMAMRVGERLRMSGAELRALGLAAMLHDVGKLRMPDEIIQKPGRLTADEYAVLQQHPVDGAELLAAEPNLAVAADIVRAHHERVDGTGYPDGLAGAEIPLAARIIAVCDAFDAMTHDRPYRAALSIPLAKAVLREYADSQWDAEVIEHAFAVFPAMLAVGAFDAVGRLDGGTVADDVPEDIGALLDAVDAEI